MSFAGGGVAPEKKEEFSTRNSFVIPPRFPSLRRVRHASIVHGASGEPKGFGVKIVHFNFQPEN